MRARQPLPLLWLLSDERNDAGLERALARLPRGSGFIYRHYHLPPGERRARFARLVRIARRNGHLVLLAGDPATARAWGADGVYGSATSGRQGLLHLAAAHSLREIARANRARADAVLLSPVFLTRSHPGARALGPLRFRMLAAYAEMPVIALGGMNAHTASGLGWPRWAAIDGLS
jgi:thiamine-phosphate pyrophosphorylase